MKKVPRPLKGNTGLRIGIHAGELTSEHPLMDIVWHTFERLSRVHEVVLFDVGPLKMSQMDEEIRSMVRASGLRYVDLREKQAGLLGKDMGDRERMQYAQYIANVIASFGLNILVELTGLHTGQGASWLMEPFGDQLAEVTVVHGVSFAGTTGCPKVDYYITDDCVTPDRAVNSWVEGLCFMPGTYFHTNHSENFSHLQNSMHGKTKTGMRYVLNSFQLIPSCAPEDVDKVLVS